MNRFVLVTGGAGFVGSHTCVALVAAGYTPVIFDNFSNTDEENLQKISRITGNMPLLAKGDVRDPEQLKHVLAARPYEAVLHFAGLKAVVDSIHDPLGYYDTNVHGTVMLAFEMQRAGVRTLIFSSSATVYGEPESSPVPEHVHLDPVNPYGRSKLMAEKVLADLCNAQGDWQVVALRYFNPVGAHESGLVGEQPRGTPNNLMPRICEVALGLREELFVHGTDYPTPDGTAVRDYVHVMDVAEGHVAALRYAQAHRGWTALNLGTGRGHSVLEVISAFEGASGRRIPYRAAARRPGDVPAYWSDPSRARTILGWHARRDLEQMCADTWRWQQRHRLTPWA